ncbi:MAG: response regulator [Pseudomonadota bacterium]
MNAGTALVDQAHRSLYEIEVQSTDICMGLRIVLADDSSNMRQLLKGILENMGAEIIGEAVDGQQAITMAAQHQPDIICLDVEIPTVSGIDALAKIHASHPSIKAVMVTSRADLGTAMRAISLGACGYILKPYKPDQLETALRKVIRYKRKQLLVAKT